jgi:uncharacterized protein (TIGR00288 family)
MKTMLLIDADNVSVGVMEQAVAALLKEHGALHVRRAYCTAESAAKHQAVFKRLGIRPVVNLATGKNSTDIAMAIDALDLAIAERPDLVAIASSDSDFAPLVLRLREKGCRVVGIGQEGKTGDETRTVYDAFSVLAHRGPAAAKKTPARTRATPAEAPAPAPRKTAARRKPAVAVVRKTVAASAPLPEPLPAPVAAPNPAPTLPAEPVADKARQILMALPELVRGDTVELRVAAERLRAAGLLSKSGVSTRVFGAFPERFELLPAKNPNKVRLKS